MTVQRCKIAVLLMTLLVLAASFLVPKSSAQAAASEGDTLDQQLTAALQQRGFTGNIEASLTQRLGRQLNPALADLGRNLFHDTILGLHNDNSCAGCHAATAGFGDTQSIAI